MQENERIKALNERLEREYKAAHRSAILRGVHQGEEDAIDFSYLEFLRYNQLFGKYAMPNPEIINGAEQQIHDFYKEVREKRKMKKFSVNVNHSGTDGNLVGDYTVVITESALSDPLDNIPKGNHADFYKGWIRGIHEVWKKLDQRFFRGNNRVVFVQ